MKKKIKNIKINDKLINCLVIRGKKNKSEKIVLQNFKTLQKTCKKSFKKLFKLALIYNTPFFKINKFTKKKKQKNKIIPRYILNKNSRVSYAIKFIIKSTFNQKNQSFSKIFFQEILSTSQNRINTTQVKKEIQKEALTNKFLLKYYRWSVKT